MENKTNLKVRIRGRNNFYLNLTEGASVEITLPNGFIVGSIQCKAKNIVAVKMDTDKGWTIVATKNSEAPKTLKDVWLGVADTNQFIDENKEE